MFTAHILNWTLYCDLWRVLVASTGSLLLFWIKWSYRNTSTSNSISPHGVTKTGIVRPHLECTVVSSFSSARNLTLFNVWLARSIYEVPRGTQQQQILAIIFGRSVCDASSSPAIINKYTPVLRSRKDQLRRLLISVQTCSVWCDDRRRRSRNKRLYGKCDSNRSLWRRLPKHMRRDAFGSSPNEYNEA